MGNRVFRLTGIIAISLSMAACASSDSRPRVISSNGVNGYIKELASKNSQSQVKLFVDSAQSAFSASDPNSAAIANPATQKQFVRQGFALIKDRCRFYLSAKADRQHDVNVWRDLFAPITALSTGAIALIDGGDTIDTDYLTALGLATNAANSGFEIYEERFLFGAQNMDAVRELVEEALRVDAEEKLKFYSQDPSSIDPSKPDISYTTSVDFLVGNQMICSPHHILRMVNEAIKAGKVTPISNRESGGEPANEAPADGTGTQNAASSNSRNEESATPRGVEVT